jgi:hypothetical protein
MLVVIPLVSLTDRRPARQLYLASSVLSALSCFGMALCDSLLPAIGFRALAGIAMAGMYMPGLRALTHGVEGAIRARIAAWYTSSFTIGASLSFLFGRVATLLGWRSAFIVAGILGAAGVLIAWAALPGGDTGGEDDPQAAARFSPGPGEPEYPRPDRRLRRGHLGLRRIAAVDCRLPHLLRRRAGSRSRAGLDHSGGRSGDQFSRRARRPDRQRAVDPLRPAHHRDPGLRALGGRRRFVRLHGMLRYIAVLRLSVVAGFIVQGNFSIIRTPRRSS